MSEIGLVFDSVPVEAKELRQYAPVIAVYKTKLTLVKSGVQKAFADLVDFSKERTVLIKSSPYDTPSLWMSASKLRMENVILSDIATRVTKSILDEIVKHNQVVFASSEARWSFAGKPEATELDLHSVCECIVSVMNFLKGSVFVALGGDRILTEFGRRVWPSLSAGLLKKFKASQELCNLEVGLIQIGLIPSEAARKLSAEWERSLADTKARDKSKILAEVRSRLLADVNRKIRKIDKTGPLGKFKFVPDMISVEVSRFPGEYFRENGDLIPSIISLFCLLRQTQYVDPKALNARMAGIFFNDTVFLTLALSMIPEGGKKYQPELSLLKSAGQKSTEAFLGAVVARAHERLLAFRDRSWDLGLTTQKQFQQAEKDINDALTQVIACINEWRSVMIAPEIISLWATIMIERIVRQMNSLYVTFTFFGIHTS